MLFEGVESTHRRQHLLVQRSNENTLMCEICSKLVTKTPEGVIWLEHRSSVFIFNFEQISHIALVFSIAAVEQVNTG